MCECLCVIDWQKQRENFPALKNKVYLNSASIGPLHRRVADKVISDTHRALELGGVEHLIFEELEEARTTVAKHINAPRPENVAFLPNSSLVMNYLAMMMRDPSKNKIVTTEDEFPASTMPWLHHGFEVDYAPVDKVLDHVDDETLAVVVSYCQFNTGYRLDIESLGKKLFDKNIPFIVNATQSIGAYPIDVQAANISAMTASCHKWLNAGFGVNVTYLSDEFLKDKKLPAVGWISTPEIFDLNNRSTTTRHEATALECGTIPLGQVNAVGEAIKVVDEIGVKNISARVIELSNLLEKCLNQFAQIKLLSNRVSDNNKTGTLLYEVPDAEALVATLAKKNIVVSNRNGKLRISIHYFNNMSDLEILLAELAKVLDETAE